MLASPPIYEAVAVVEDKKLQPKFPKIVMGFEWLKYLGAVAEAVDKAPSRQAHVRLTSQTASIGVTPIPLGSVPVGVYRISYYFRVTRAGSVSSALQFTLSWTEGGVALSASGANETGNATTTKQLGTMPIRVDANTPISYSTTYADGGGAVAMAYLLNVVCEQLALDTV